MFELRLEESKREKYYGGINWNDGVKRSQSSMDKEKKGEKVKVRPSIWGPATTYRRR